MEVENKEFESAFAEMSGEPPIEEPTAVDETPEEEQPEEAPQEDTPAEEAPAEPDPLEALQRERDDWRHRYMSDAGRVGAFQKRINELEAALNEAKQTGTKAEQAEAKAELSDELKAFRDDFPEHADAIEQFSKVQVAREREALRQELQQQMNERLGPVLEHMQFRQQEEQATTLAQQDRMVEQQHPGWKDVVRTKEFGEWWQRQPPGIQALSQSDHAADAIALISMYKGVSLQATVDTNKADQVARRRNQQLADAQALPPSRVSQRDPGDGSFEAEFDRFAKRS